MRTQLRITAGALRNRKLLCTVHPDLRPMSERVRQALFSILGDAVPERPFFDVFAGTGAVGLEALSRGANPVVFIERDFRASQDIVGHLKSFGVAEQALVQRADAYRWGEHWQAPAEPVNVFLGPPYPDYERRLDDFVLLVHDLQQKLAPGSVLILQADHDAPDVKALPGTWEERGYGRNRLLLWVKTTVNGTP